MTHPLLHFGVGAFSAGVGPRTVWGETFAGVEEPLVDRQATGPDGGFDWVEVGYGNVTASPAWYNSATGAASLNRIDVGYETKLAQPSGISYPGTAQTYSQAVWTGAITDLVIGPGIGIPDHGSGATGTYGLLISGTGGAGLKLYRWSGDNTIVNLLTVGQPISGATMRLELRDSGGTCRVYRDYIAQPSVFVDYVGAAPTNGNFGLVARIINQLGDTDYWDNWEGGEWS